uniref:Antistasin-like domain-containing protein n=1 Tax=Biomphalaria glabrata TaxID=6526 RepID=A0A2C9M0M5_BIOGL
MLLSRASNGKKINSDNIREKFPILLEQIYIPFCFSYKPTRRHSNMNVKSTFLFLCSLLFTQTLAGLRIGPAVCMLACDFDNGYVLSDRGCSCVKVKGSSPACPELRCGPRACLSFKTDVNGCPTCDCDCRPAVCPSTPCRYGVQHFTDGKGCPACSCLSPAPR